MAAALHSDKSRDESVTCFGSVNDRSRSGQKIYVRDLFSTHALTLSKLLTETRNSMMKGVTIATESALISIFMLFLSRSVSSFTFHPLSRRVSSAVWPAEKTIGIPSTSKHLARMTSSSSDSTAALLNCPSIPLRDGIPHPAIGFGTYKVGFIPASASAAASESAPQRTARECVADALSVGYRFLECAEFYGNEHEVGKAIADSGVNRSDLFICSKVWTTTIEQGADAIRAQLTKTLTSLQTDYVDLYLIHWPVPGHHVDAYKTLIELKKEGKIKGIGVSNYAQRDCSQTQQVYRSNSRTMVCAKGVCVCPQVR